MTRLFLVISLIIASCGIARAAVVDPFAGDPRFTVKRTLQVHDEPVRDLLADLSLQTGARFFAEPAIGEDKLTVFSHERPLADTLNAVAKFFRFEWRRDGKAPDFGYTLLLSPSAREDEAATRRDRIHQAAERIQAEVRIYAQLEPLSPTDLHDRLEAAIKELLAVRDPAKRRELRLVIALGQQMGLNMEWRRVIFRFLRSQPVERIEAMLGGDSYLYSWPVMQGYQEFPSAVVDDIKALGTPSAGTGLPPIGEINFLHLILQGEMRRDPILKWHIMMGKRNINSYSSAEFDGLLPTALPPDESPTDAVFEPAGWRDDGRLLRPVTLKVGANANPRAGGRVTLGEALAAIDKVQPLDVIADSFQSDHFAGLQADAQPLGELLTRVCRYSMHRWSTEGGFVLLRSQSYDTDRRVEPPASDVERWAQHARGSGLEIEDYGEMAALPDAQLTTLIQMAARGDFPDSLQTVMQARDHLRLWNSLTLAQRRKARTPNGVAFAELTKDQQKIVQVALQRRPTGPAMSAIATAQLATVRFRLQVRESRLWGAKINNVSNLNGLTTFEEALAAFRHVDPDLPADKVKSVVFVYLTFEYLRDTGKSVEGFASFWGSLPARWEDVRTRSKGEPLPY